jgi:lysyl-tRNA synthetase class I
LHSQIHQIKNDLKIEPRLAFEAIYQIFLKRKTGPQAGWFLASLDKKLVEKLLKEAIK